MSEESKKVEHIEKGAKSAELSEQDLDKVAGGTVKVPPIPPIPIPPTKPPTSGPLL